MQKLRYELKFPIDFAHNRVLKWSLEHFQK